MGALFIAAGLFASVPAVFLGVNNGATLLGVLVMAYAGTRILRGRA
jgi:hypothetical protein